jgi:hypothetical protein
MGKKYKSSETKQNALFSFFATFEENFLQLVADLKKGKWRKNISEQAANSYREISARERENCSDNFFAE